MLLRHNSDLRNFYKNYCNSHDNIIGNNFIKNILNVKTLFT